MDQRQLLLVQDTFIRASRAGAHLAATFYAELFAIDPALKPMFKGDMVAQGQKLMKTLATVIEGLKQPESVLPIARALAIKHVEYGVEPHHYGHVGTALLRTLKHELGANFTPEARAAWSAAYMFLAETMIEAAYGQKLARAI